MRTGICFRRGRHIASAESRHRWQCPTIRRMDRIPRTVRAAKNAGINRVQWDLRYDPGDEIRLRTPPIYGSWVRIPPDGRTAGGRLQLLAPPGTYTVKLGVDGNSPALARDYTQ